MKQALHRTFLYTLHRTQLGPPPPQLPCTVQLQLPDPIQLDVQDQTQMFASWSGNHEGEDEMPRHTGTGHTDLKMHIILTDWSSITRFCHYWHNVLDFFPEYSVFAAATRLSEYPGYRIADMDPYPGGQASVPPNWYPFVVTLLYLLFSYDDGLELLELTDVGAGILGDASPFKCWPSTFFQVLDKIYVFYCQCSMVISSNCFWLTG